MMLFKIARKCSVLTFILLSSCTLHRYTINDKPVDIVIHKPIPTRIPVEVVRNQPEKETTGSREDEFRSYNSADLEKYLSQGCCFSISKQSGYTLRYNSTITNELLYPLTVFLFLGTLGVFPVFEESTTTIDIKLEEPNRSQTRELRYIIRDNLISSWLTIPIYIFLNSDTYALAVFYGTTHPQKLMANKIESDLYWSLVSEGLASTPEKNNVPFTIHNKQKLAILPITYKSQKHEVLAESMRDKLETLMVSNRYTVVERVMLQKIIEELKLNQSGLTESNTTRLGQMSNASHIIIGELFDVSSNDQLIEFSVKSIEIETGKILWKYDYEMDETDIVKSGNRVISDLDKKLK
jgi:TolB-like protein